VIYLDSAATSLRKPASVYHAVNDALARLSSPGRGGYRSAMDAAEVLFDTRCAAAELFHVPEPERVVFTQNATHGLNIAVRSVVRPGARTVVTGYEHNAVMRPLHALGARIEIAAAPLFDRDAALAAFAEKLPGADAAVVNHVSNVFGSIQPLEEIAAMCRERGVPLIVDASQSAGSLPLDFGALGCAFMAMPGHKGLLGPQGTGLLLCGDARAEPLMQGGTGSDSASYDMPAYLPDRLEAGTHNMPGIAGLRAGLRYLLKRGVKGIGEHEARLMRRVSDALRGAPGIRMYRSGDGEMQSGVLSLQFDGLDCEEAAAALGERGIAVRAGLHCAPLAHRTAGTFERGTVRLSFSPFTTEREAREAAQALRELAERSLRAGHL